MTRPALSALTAALALTLALSAPALAGKECVRIVNQTNDWLGVTAKTSGKEFCRVAPKSQADCCCDALLSKDCFDKKGGKIKIKISREGRNGLESVSGDTCFKLYAPAGTNIEVTGALDGRHIDCAMVSASEIKTPLPTFEDADLNRDGVIDAKEAARVGLDERLKSQGGFKPLTRQDYEAVRDPRDSVLGVKF